MLSERHTMKILEQLITVGVHMEMLLIDVDHWELNKRIDPVVAEALRDTGQYLLDVLQGAD